MRQPSRAGILSVCLTACALTAGAVPGSASQAEWELQPRIPMPKNSGVTREAKAFAPDDVWVGGNSESGDSGTEWKKAEMRHWDGHRWTATPLDNAMGSTVSEIDGVASDDLWAVNRRWGTPGRMSLQHWDGTKWTPTPVPRGTHDLYAVEAVASDDVWAVGDPGSILHWDGRAWSPVAVPPEFQAATFQDVTATAPDDVWAVGARRDDKGIAHPLALHWNGEKWTKVELPRTPDGDEGGRHVSTVAATDGQVWLGTQSATPSGILVPITFRVDAAGITTTPILQPDSLTLSDMTVVGDTVRLAVSDYVDAPVLEWRRDRWAPMPALPLRKDAHVVSGLATVPGTNEMWAVGHQNAIPGSPPDTLFSPMAARLR